MTHKAIETMTLLIIDKWTIFKKPSKKLSEIGNSDYTEIIYLETIK